jgi:hypothetical protein
MCARSFKSGNSLNSHLRNVHKSEAEQAGLEKTQWVFLAFWFFLGFFDIFVQKREFLGIFQFQ